MTARRPAECGEPAGYQKHRRNGTEPCRACRDAWNAYGRDREQARHLIRAAAEREAAEQAERARVEDPVLAAHFAGELVLG